jgi:hypothetical protein
VNLHHILWIWGKDLQVVDGGGVDIGFAKSLLTSFHYCLYRGDLETV